MKQNLITDVIQGMLPYLNNAQTERLQEVLQHTLFDYEVIKTEEDKEFVPEGERYDIIYECVHIVRLL